MLAAGVTRPKAAASPEEDQRPRSPGHRASVKEEVSPLRTQFLLSCWGGIQSGGFGCDLSSLAHRAFPVGLLRPSLPLQSLKDFMDKFVIRGGEPLLGTVRVSGAKNAALPCMAAALLTDQPVILENIPQVRDIQTTRNLLAAMGAEVELGYGRAHHRTTIHCAKLAAP